MSSATVDAEELRRFFSLERDRQTAAILSVEGRQHPVQVYYSIGSCVGTRTTDLEGGGGNRDFLFGTSRERECRLCAQSFMRICFTI